MAYDAEPNAENPLQDVVLCCTALPQEIRTKLADAAIHMGAVHKLDLTSDVTHLIVGSIDTPKYRYVAKDRPDICVLRPDFIDAVREAWMEGDEVDVTSLQRDHALPALFGLKLCVTGFEDPNIRRQLERTICTNGATYTGDLVRQVTHLIAARPEGAKYTHAKQWGIKVVGLKWLDDSLLRGMALDESFYSPEMPFDQQGIGAVRSSRKVNLAKRARAAEHDVGGEKDGPRKMRRTASRRLENHSQDLWKSVSEHEVQVDATELDMWNEETQTLRNDSAESQQHRNSETSNMLHHDSSDRPEGLFTGLHVLIHGFDAKKKKMLSSFLEPNGAVVVDSPKSLETAADSVGFKSPVLLIPYAMPSKLPAIPAGTILVTDWWLERCIHFKQFLDPQDDALSQPHANSLVPTFQNMTISTTGFNSVDLRQTAIVVELMGATYQEQLQSSTSILVSGSKDVRRDKALYASKHRIPVVTMEWLWTSLKSKEKAPVERHRISLPAFDPSEYSGSPAASDGSPSEAVRPRPTGEPVRRAGDAHPKRLSNTRKRYATPSLIMKPSNNTETFRPSEPSSLRRAHTGPFILEDDGEDLEAVVSLDDCSASLNVAQSLSQTHSKVLREISPNTSQQRTENSAAPEGRDENAEQPAGDVPEHENISARPVSPRSPSKENDAPSGPPTHKLKEDLAEILKRQNSSSFSNSTAPTKRKSRPLGRNLSSISSRSGSVAAAPPVPEDVFEANSMADGFDYSKADPTVPPSTQLGYDTPEAEAHRKQMSKKMGTTMLQDEGVGKRVASVGTVKDSSSRSGVGGRTKGRTRTKT